MKKKALLIMILFVIPLFWLGTSIIQVRATTNSQIITVWAQTYGGSGDDASEQVKATFDGGYIITGLTYSSGVDADVYLVKTNSDGIEEWNMTYVDLVMIGVILLGKHLMEDI